MPETTGTATAKIMAGCERKLDVALYCTDIGQMQATLVLDAKQVARDHAAQVEQARLLLEFLTPAHSQSLPLSCDV